MSPSLSTAQNRTPNSVTYHRPWMYPKQSAAIFCDERYAVVEASTKSGKTLGCIAWLVEQAWRGKSGRNYWWVAPIYPQAKIAFRRIKSGLTAGSFTTNESELTITLLNGAVLWFKGGDKPDSLYGEDVYAAVIDEASRCKDEAWHALRSTLTQTRGPIRVIGNVKGRKNWAYKMARRAEAGEPDMRYTKITAHDAVAGGVLDAAEIEDAKRQLPAHVFEELYLAEPSDDGGNPFGIDAIRACIAPLSTEPPVGFGIDLAKSQDYTVVIGLDKQHHVCVFERWQGPWETTISRIDAIVGLGYALVDSTGVGDPVLEALQKRSGTYEGYKFTQPSKQQLMEGLAVEIQQQKTGFPDGEIGNELEAFEYEYTRTGCRYAAPEGLHDDCVMGYALAIKLVGTHVRPYSRYRDDPEFRKTVLPQQTGEERVAARIAAYKAS